MKDGKEYGVTSRQTWRARWWDYYDRGSSYATGEYWDEALADFQAAIRQRHDDQRHARTYGMHRSDYFPHRELGIVYYRQGRHTEAIDELTTSLSSVDTAKAKFYLNRARRSFLQQTRRDTAAPRIVFTTPPDELLTNRLSVTVTGYAEDDTYVSALVVHGQAQFVELAEPRLVFTQEVELRDGANAIDVVADDLVGQQTRARRTVHLDRHGPLLSLEQVEVAGTPPQQRVRVQGLLTDQSRITRFMLAGRAMPAQPGSAWEVREEFPLTGGEEFVAFEAEDAAGNVTHGQIALRAPVDGPAGTRQGMRVRHPLLRWTSSTFPPGGGRQGWGGEVSGGGDTGGVLSAQVAQHRDRHAPVIKLMGLGEQESTVDDSIYLEGQVTDASAIVAFAINGASLWRRNARQLFFGQRFPLQEGENTFALEAVDEAGNTAQLKVVVTRAVRPVRQMGSRLRVVLLPFAKKGEAPVLAEAVHDYLFNVFVQQRRFDFIERQRLEAILQELTLRQKLTQGALIDPASAAETGKSIATAEGIMIGTVTETAQSLEILARFVDVDTAVVMAVGDVYGEDLTPPTVKTLVEGLVWKLQRQFPLAEGVVLEKAGKQLFTDLNERHGVKRSMKLLIFRPGQEFKHPQTGRLLKKPDVILGEARITAVSPDLSEALVLPSEGPGDVRESDMVITK